MKYREGGPEYRKYEACYYTILDEDTVYGEDEEDGKPERIRGSTPMIYIKINLR
jgi:hypothetical protein